MQRAWKGIGGAFVLLIALSFFVPLQSWGHTLLEIVVGAMSASIIAIGAIRSRRASGSIAWAWMLLAAGIASNTAGTLCEAVAFKLMGATREPLLATLLWLGLYPAFVGALVLLLRRESKAVDWASVIDMAIVISAAALATWVWLIEPIAIGAHDEARRLMLSVAYPIGDLAVMCLLIRLVFGNDRRPAWFTIMLGSIASFMVGDFLWAVVNKFHHSVEPALEAPLDAVFLVAYALAALAAVHPSTMHDDAGAEGARDYRRLRLCFLTIASLSAPCLLIMESMSGSLSDGLAIGIGAALIFTLVVVRMSELLQRIETQARQLQRLAQIDELTGLPNRRAWNLAVQAAHRRAKRDQRPLTVAILDIDHFKKYNDTYGHPAGDGLLRAAAQAWQGQIREIDMLARYGGEEFVVLFADTPDQIVKATLGRLVRATPLGQTFSAGVAMWDGSETVEELLQRSDQALYRAKQTGRNKVCVSTSSRTSHLKAVG